MGDFISKSLQYRLKFMRRSFTPLPGTQTKVMVVVESAQDEVAEIILTEESVFGSTSMMFNPSVARQVAQTLLKAADAAEVGDETRGRKSKPKLAAL